MNLPTLSAIALVATMLSQSKKTPAQVVQSGLKSQSTPGGHPLNRPTGPSQLWVDKPVNTTLRNDAGAIRNDTTAGIASYLKETYMREARTHPGVRLVAGQAVA